MTSMDLRARARKLGANTLLLFASAGLTCLALEGALRLLAPQPLGLRFYTREGILLHYPGARIRYVRADFQTTVTINSDGLRDREYPPGKPPGVYRILVLGDSFTEGLQVDDSLVWPKVAERILGEDKRRRGPRVEFVNAGFAGAGTADQIRYLEAFGRRWDPDLVLLAFYCGNDVRDNLAERGLEIGDGTVSIPRRRPAGPVSYRLRTARSWLGSHSHLYQFVRDRLAPDRTRESAGGSSGPRSEGLREDRSWQEFDDKRVLYSPVPEDVARGWEITRHLLDRAEKDSLALGARFALVALPGRRMVDESLMREKLRFKVEPGFELDPGLPGRQLQDWASRKGVPFKDLYPEFKARKADATFHYRNDAHWNARGHQAAAEVIAAFLAESALVPAPGT